MMKTIKELEAEIEVRNGKTNWSGKIHMVRIEALKDVLKLIDEVIKKHTKIHYHAKRSCPQAIREELKARITG